MGSQIENWLPSGAMVIHGYVLLVSVSDMGSCIILFPSRWKFFRFMAHSFGLLKALGITFKLGSGCKEF